MKIKLSKDYGGSSEYTEGQVKTAFGKLGYDKELEDVAIAIFCNEKIAKEFGIDEARIREYKGYPRTHYIESAIGGGGDGFEDGGGGD